MRAASLCGCLLTLQATTCLGLRVNGPPKAKFSPSRLVQQAIAATDAELKKAEASIAEEQTTIRQTILYVDKITSSIGREDSLFNGKMDQADVKMAMKFMPLFNSTTFLTALDDCIRELGNFVKNSAQLSSKRVKEATSKPHDTDTARHALATRFFEKETNLMGKQISLAGDAMKNVLQALPEDYSAYARLGSAMVEDFQNASRSIMAHFLSSEENFCDQTPSAVQERAMPMVRYVQGLLPRIENFTATQLPEVLPEVSKRVKKLTALSEKTIQTLQRDALDVVAQVCGTIRAENVEPEALAEAAAQPVTEAAAAEPAAVVRKPDAMTAAPAH